jgi:hypothetical protein
MKPYFNTTYVQGVARPGPPQHIQAGGNPLAALLAIGSALKAIKPFTHAKTLLESHVGEKGKKSTAYKIGHGIASVGSSIGIGHTKKANKKKRKSSTSKRKK